MIYIPMLKTRKEELRVLKLMKEHYSDKIIPLIEVICEIYNPNYLTDEMVNLLKKNVILSIERLNAHRQNKM